MGRVERLPPLGDGVNRELRIRAWLPPGYDEGGSIERVLYVLDGQFAFAGDSEGINFAADWRIARLIRTGTIPPTMVVALDNLGDRRFLQYMPETIRDSAGPGVRETVDREIARTGGKPLVSSKFIDFVSGPLRRTVDSRYRTSGNSNHNAIFGASMAGVMSGALFVEAQGMFGRAGCMSPNWAIYDNRFIDHPGLPEVWGEYFAMLGDPAERRLWLDHGTEMMDKGMVPHQHAIARRLERLGWKRGCNLLTRVYEAGHAFAETASQMDEMLSWLLA
jgi:predicted alpha/beta superfamily hydrolase